MTQPMTPREKVAAAIREHIKVDATGLAPAIASAFIVGVDQAADAILAALSGSGDHAELARAIDRLLPIGIHNTPDYAEVYFGECRAQAMTMEPDTWLALNQLPALIAENAALRDDVKVARADLDHLEAHFRQRDFEATEAERKLAEARGHIMRLADWIEHEVGAELPYAEGEQDARTFLSSTEAVRG